MKKLFLASLAIIAVDATAAPLDAFLTADHPALAWHPELEAGYDLANHSIDFLHLAPKKTPGSTSRSGDYNGEHVRLGLNITPSIWVDGAAWSRKVDYASVTAQITTWQVAGQYLAFQSENRGLSLAVRGGAWGNSAPSLHKTTSVTVAGTTFTSALETHPRDLELQLDFIASWRITEGLTLNGSAGGGRSKVDFDKVSATSLSHGCLYDVQFTDTTVIATCEQNGNSTRIAVPNAVYGIDVNQEARYNANYANLGLNVQWNISDWRLRGGVQYMKFNRGTIDDVVVARGGRAYKSNEFYLAEIAYHVTPHLLPLIRAQVMAHQFVGEAPLTYNSLTATQQRRPYGILTLGLAYNF
jgi:hypothetical protein